MSRRSPVAKVGKPKAAGSVTPQEAARGLLLRNARIRAGYLNASEFADLIDVAPNSVYRHEAGRMAPSVGVLVAWARACGVPLESLAVAVDRKGAA